MRKAGLLFSAAAIVVFIFGTVSAQTTEFSYQGSLRDGASNANGNYDFEFNLFDAVVGGNQLGITNAHYNEPLVNGIFGVKLDFGAVFPGADRFLEIRVRPNGNGAFTTLSPRRLVNSTPYSLKSLNAENAASANTATTAGNSLQLGGIAANQFVVTTDPRMSDARPPTAGSSNYVQNTTTLQASTNFNISGIGRANIISATTQYDLNGDRILSRAGTNNMFVGAYTGQNNTTGANNAFFGSSAGIANTTGISNAFYGNNAGQSNTTGSLNSFFGRDAGQDNTIGSSNSFFGGSAGFFNTSGAANSFFGLAAGYSNTTGIENSFFGRFAGYESNGNGNAFFGNLAGRFNSTGDFNSFFGGSSGTSNTTGTDNAFFGHFAGQLNTTGINNTFIGQNTGSATTTGDNNTFLGKGAGTTNTTGSSNTMIGYNAELGSANLTFASAIGAGAIVTTSDTLVLGRSSDIVRVPGFIRVLQLGGAGPTPLCHNANFTISTCSSSLRYKTNIGRFGLGLNLINQLKPITFDWKDGGMHDLGLGAEDVAAIEPLLVTYNAKGEVEGVKYDRIGVVLVNAVKEQQSQIDAQQKEIAERKETEQKLQSQIDELKTIVCSLKPNAAGCKQEEK